MIQTIIIGTVGALALVGISVGLYRIKQVHDEIRSFNRHLAEQVDTALNQGIRIVR
jgi:hypothetical protein